MLPLVYADEVETFHYSHSAQCRIANAFGTNKTEIDISVFLGTRKGKSYSWGREVGRSISSETEPEGEGIAIAE